MKHLPLLALAVLVAVILRRPDHPVIAAHGCAEE